MKKQNLNEVMIEVKKHKASYLMMAPYFILFFFFTVLPVVASIVLSFTNFNMLEMPQFIGWKNYIRLFLDDDIFMVAFKNTLILLVLQDLLVTLCV